MGCNGCMPSKKQPEQLEEMIVAVSCEMEGGRSYCGIALCLTSLCRAICRGVGLCCLRSKQKGGWGCLGSGGKGGLHLPV